MTDKLIKYFEAEVFDETINVSFKFDQISYFEINKDRHVTDPHKIEYHDCFFYIYPLRALNSQEGEILNREWKSYCPQ